MFGSTHVTGGADVACQGWGIVYHSAWSDGVEQAVGSRRLRCDPAGQGGEGEVKLKFPTLTSNQHLRVPLVANGDVKQLQDVYDIFNSCCPASIPSPRLTLPPALVRTEPWQRAGCW